jgi:methylated-DNA-[protein]-cysteine S-methyltransferase
MHCYSEVETEIGRLRVGFHTNGITMICLSQYGRTTFENAYQKRLGVRPQRAKIPESFRDAIVKAAAGHAFNSIPMDLSGLSKFHQRVLRALQRVPRGDVRTYGWLARKAGRPKAARAVGSVMAHNPIPILIPCHRVVPAAGGIGNYGMGSTLKRTLLALEGVAVDRL